MIDFKKYPYSLMLAFMDIGFKEKQAVKKLKSIYSNHRESINCHNQIRKINNGLFDPIFYHVWGDFSVVAISINDDYYFASKVLKPYTGAQESNDLLFKHQLSTGPLLLDSINIPKLASKKYNRYFCCISQIKLNNALLIGNGFDLVIEAVEAIKKQLGKNKEITYLISFNYGWNELNLVMFSDKINLLFATLSNIHELKLTKSLLFSNSIKSNWLKKNMETSLFSKIHTTFGFNPNLLNEDISRIDFSQCKLTCRFHIQPGSFSYFRNLLLKNKIIGKEEKFAWIVGKGVAILNLGSKLDVYINLVRGIESIYRPETNGNDKFDCLKRIKTFLFTPLLEESKINEDRKGKATKLIHPKIYDLFMFSSTYIRQVDSKLKELNLSKILSERIIRLLINYNHALNDRIIYIFFIGLNKHLDDLIQSILKINPDDKAYAINKIFDEDNLHKLVDGFEQAIWSRIYQTHLFGDFTDLTTEYSGGIQQIILSYENYYRYIYGEMYKILNKVLSSTENSLSDEDVQIVSISSLSHVTSREKAIELNPIFIYQPELFLSVVSHEALNFFQIKKNVKSFEAILPISNLHRDNASFFGPELIRKYMSKVLRRHYLPKDGLSNLDYNIFRTILIDVLSYKYFYHSNKKNYCFWYFANIVQADQNYDFNGNPELKYFSTYLIRNFMVLELSGESPFKFEEFKKIIDIKILGLNEDSFLQINEFVADFADLFDSSNKLIQSKLLAEIRRFLCLSSINTKGIDKLSFIKFIDIINPRLKNLFIGKEYSNSASFKWDSIMSKINEDVLLRNNINLKFIYQVNRFYLREKDGNLDINRLNMWFSDSRLVMFKKIHKELDSLNEYNLSTELKDSILYLRFLIGLLAFKSVINLVNSRSELTSLLNNLDYVEALNRLKTFPITILERDSHRRNKNTKNRKSTKIIKCNEKGSFDRTGGILIPDPIRRREFHRSANEIILKMWHSSTKIELEEIIKKKLLISKKVK